MQWSSSEIERVRNFTYSQMGVLSRLVQCIEDPLIWLQPHHGLGMESCSHAIKIFPQENQNPGSEKSLLTRISRLQMRVGSSIVTKVNSSRRYIDRLFRVCFIVVVPTVSLRLQKCLNREREQWSVEKKTQIEVLESGRSGGTGEGRS